MERAEAADIYMITLTIHNAYTYVSGSTAEQDTVIMNALRARNPKHYLGFGAKYIHFYDPALCKFYTGLLPRVKVHLRNRNWKFLVVDRRTKLPPIPDKILSKVPFEFTPRQRKAIRIITKRGTVIVAGAVNSGKTDISIECLHRFLTVLQKDEVLLVIVDSQNLLDEWVERLQASGIEDVGIIHGHDFHLRPITVTTFQTLARRLENRRMGRILTDRTRGYVADECHKAGKSSGSYARCLERLNRAYIRIGLSGTAFDYGNDRNFVIVGLIGNYITKLPDEELVTEGRSARPSYAYIDVWKRTSRPRILSITDWGTTKHLCITKNPEIPSEIAKHLKATPNYPTVIFVNEIKQGNYIFRRLPKSIRVRGRWISTNKKRRERKEVLEKFNRGELQFILTSPILDTGVNKLRRANYLIMAGGGKSPVRLMQRTGRGLRRKEKNNWVVVILLRHAGVARMEKHLAEQLMRLKKAFPNILKEELIPSTQKSLR